MKIKEKVSFKHVYILNGQKLIKNAKNGLFWRVFENLKLKRSNRVTRQVTFNRTKIGGMEIANFECDILSDFQTMCDVVESFRQTISWFLST